MKAENSRVIYSVNTDADLTKMLISLGRPMSCKGCPKHIIAVNCCKKDVFSALDILPEGSVIHILVQL